MYRCVVTWLILPLLWHQIKILCFADAGALNYLQGVLHDDLAEKFKEIMTGKGKLTANDFDDILPQLTAKLGKIQISYSK